MPTTMPSVLPHPMQLSNLATAVRMRSQEGSSPLSSPIQKPAPNRKPRKKRVDLHGKLEAMSDEPLADLLRAQTQPWTPEEDHLIVQMVEQVGHKWSAIATLLPGRTDNGVRNRWNRLDRCCPAFDSPLSTRLPACSSSSPSSFALRLPLSRTYPPSYQSSYRRPAFPYLAFLLLVASLVCAPFGDPRGSPCHSPCADAFLLAYTSFTGASCRHPSGGPSSYHSRLVLVRVPALLLPFGPSSVSKR